MKIFSSNCEHLQGCLLQPLWSSTWPASEWNLSSYLMGISHCFHGYAASGPVPVSLWGQWLCLLCASCLLKPQSKLCSWLTLLWPVLVLPHWCLHANEAPKMHVKIYSCHGQICCFPWSCQDLFSQRFVNACTNIPIHFPWSISAQTWESWEEDLVEAWAKILSQCPQASSSFQMLFQ